MPVEGSTAQIGGHHRHRAAQVAEGRLGHQLVLELDERGNAAVHRAGHEFECGSLPRLGFEFTMFLAAYLLAPRLTQVAPFFGSCPLHDPEDTTPGLRGARRNADEIRYSFTDSQFANFCDLLLHSVNARVKRPRIEQARCVADLRNLVSPGSIISLQPQLPSPPRRRWGEA
jgi:hypothetical protein